MFLHVIVQSSKRRIALEKGHSEAKRQKREEVASDGQVKEEEEDEEERLAEEKLKQLQELAEKSVTERRDSTRPSSSKACVQSSWEQIGNLMLYTAAGVRGSDKVGAVSLEQPMVLMS